MQLMLDAIRHSDPGRLGTVVLIGAGQGDGLDQLLARQPQRLVLVDGDARQAATLRRRFAGYPQIEVLGDVLAREAGLRGWHRYPLRRLNGLLAPADGLRDAYPRLGPPEVSTVQAVALSAWLEGLDIQAAAGAEQGHNVLIFDMAGVEAGLLQSLNPRQFDSFPWVLVRAAARTLYQRESTIDDVRGWMAKIGYNAVAKDTSTLLWSVELYHGDPLTRRLIAKTHEHHQATKANAQLAQELERSRAAAAHARKLAALREADLKDLQVRYEALRAQQRDSQQLLSELSRRFSVADGATAPWDVELGGRGAPPTPDVPGAHRR
jgi:hypothetical protein